MTSLRDHSSAADVADTLTAVSSIHPRPVLLRSRAVIDASKVQIGDVIKDPHTGRAATVLHHSASIPASLQLIGGVITLTHPAQTPEDLQGTPHSVVLAPGTRVRRLYRWVLRDRWQPPAPAPDHP